MAEITRKGFDGEGMQRVYENEKWTVGVKNFKPANALENLDMLERHNETDELFVLLSGSCTLLSAEEQNGALIFSKVEMEPGLVYNIPRGLWHNTITTPGTKMVLIEDVSTGEGNSDFYELHREERNTVRDLVEGRA